MSDLYSSAHKEPGIDLTNETLGVPSANITVSSRAFAGERWYTIAQQNNEGAVAIAASTQEVKALVSVLQTALERYAPLEEPLQLRLFDPDALEADNDSRLDPA